MWVSEFLDGPCRWDWQAPARLREQVFGDACAWRSYSTSRFLDGSNPNIPHTIEFSAPAVDSAVNVEWLPPALGARWGSVGLQFASEADLSDMDGRKTLASALDFIGMDHPLMGTVAALCRSLHVLIASGRDFDVSYSDPSLPLSVFVSCPFTGGTKSGRTSGGECRARSTALAAFPGGESSSRWSLMVRTTNLSSLRGRMEWRTVRGLVHAVYVFGNLRCFWKGVASNRPESAPFAQARIRTIDTEMAGAAHLVRNRSLTAAGLRLATSILSSPSEA